jgi:chromosome partitioning protein
MPPKVITITNQKGGTGKTTLTALLAYGLAIRGRRVLMLDLDPQSHLSSLFLRINEVENISDGVLELAIQGRFKIRQIDLGVKVPGEVGLIPSGINYIIDVFRGMIPAWDPQAVYSRLMTEPAINKSYDYVICDTPPELFTPTMWGLYAADYIIIPSNMEELSLLGVKILLKEVIPDVIMKSKKEPKVLGIALINITRRVKSDTIAKLEASVERFVRQLPSAIYSRVYGKLFFDTLIYRDDELRDLAYRPRRWEIPLSRVINRSSELRSEVEGFASEVENRINNFKGMV